MNHWSRKCCVRRTGFREWSLIRRFKLWRRSDIVYFGWRKPWRSAARGLLRRLDLAHNFINVHAFNWNLKRLFKSFKFCFKNQLSNAEIWRPTRLILSRRMSFDYALSLRSGMKQPSCFAESHWCWKYGSCLLVRPNTDTAFAHFDLSMECVAYWPAASTELSSDVKTQLLKQCGIGR